MIRPLERDKFHSLYRAHIERDFPPDEIPPEGMFARMLDEDEDLHGYMYSEQDVDMGYAFVRIRGRAAFLFLFAVYDEYRGAGVGTRFMRELFDEIRGCDYIVLEAERPETAGSDEERAVRERRLRFYEHLGYTADRSIDYVVYYVPMWLMVRPLAGEAPRGEALGAAMRGFYKFAKGLPLRTDLF